MNSALLRNIARLLLLVLLQVMVFNHVHLFGFINPYLYVLFVLLLPFETPRWLLLVAGFILGFVIDSFSNTYGLHTAASTFCAFSRPMVLRLLSSRREFEPGLKPGIKDLGINWFVSYSASLILLHHFALLYLESFRFSEFFTTFFRVITNSLVSLMVIVLAQYLTERPRK